MTAHFEPVVGRYLRLGLLGRPHRLYVEEAGEGIPLICLHTAGSDGRQFRGLMNDARVTKDFRVIAFDFPWHGKSSPPAGWQDEEYRLSARDYIDIILTVMDALALERPVAMGCSIGGRVVLHLALEHPERFRALIGLQSSAHTEPYYDVSWLHRPDVHGGEVCAGVVSGLIGPDAPAADRWETLWHYMQGGPGVFKGDLYFYKVDGDIRDRVGGIDPRRCPLYLLTGEYDYSASPADTIEVKRRVPGADVTIMQGLGHFPMSEHPARFAEYLLPVLEQIRSASAPTRHCELHTGLAADPAG
jgi:pimeloyl-ACP methyl ester carboxylesterase